MDSPDIAAPPLADTRPRTDGMPSWVPRAVLLFWLGFVAVYALQGIVHALRDLFVILLVALFLSFAIEPAVNTLARRGWRRGAATGLVFSGILFVMALFTFAIGSLVVNQVRTFIDEAPDYVQDIEDWVNERFDANVEFDDVINDLNDPKGGTRQFAEDLAGNAARFSLTALGALFQMFTIALFTFYLVADGPRLRHVICSRLSPDRQRNVLRAWELAIAKTGGYLYSRVLLAGLSTSFTWIALATIGVPYPLALALWVGVISQFIPVVGTYLAGGLAVLIAVLNEPFDGLWTLAFILVYQQIENYVFAPRATAQTMSLHPAVAFAAVLVGASVLGPVGALLALPAAAVIQAFASTLGDRHEVVESALTQHPASKSRRRNRMRRRDATSPPG